MPEAVIGQTGRMPGNMPVRTVNGYNLLEVLGSGGLAIAYRAEKDGIEYCVREHRFGRKVDGLDAFKGRDLFQREYEVLKGLDHPQIPKVYDLFEHEEGRDYSLFMVQQLVPGECLEKIVQREGPLAEAKVVDVMLQLTDILKYLHDQNPPVIHRDVKPSNIMLDKETGKICLIDFGIVQQRIAKAVGGSTMFGTMGYSAPEVFAGQATTRSDLYSIGPTILKLASGISPEDVLDGFNMNYHGKFEFKNQSLGVLVDQLAQFDPDLRPKSVDEVADYLRQINQGKALVRRKDGSAVQRFISKLVPQGVFQYLVRSRHDEARKELQSGVIVETQKALPAPSESVDMRAFHIEEFDNLYRIYGVMYGGKLRVFDWYKELLDNGERRSQDGWIEYTKDRVIKLPNSRMVYANHATLFAHRNHPDPAQRALVEKVVAEIFRSDIKEHRTHISTRIAYQPQGKDRVIHNLGYANQLEVIEDIVTQGDWVHADSGLEKPIQAILGTANLTEVEQVYNWLSGMKPCLNTLKNMPKKEELRVVVFGSYGNWFGIDANYYGNVYANGPARGVVMRRENVVETVYW